MQVPENEVTWTYSLLQASESKAPVVSQRYDAKSSLDLRLQ